MRAALVQTQEEEAPTTTRYRGPTVSRGASRRPLGIPLRDRARCVSSGAIYNSYAMAMNPPSRRRRSTALLCVALLADDATAIRAYQCCTSSSSRRRSRLASPRLCDDRQVLGDPATILGFGEALRQGDVSPQLELGSIPPIISQGIDGLEMLREDELRQLEALDEPAVPMLSPACQARPSLASDSTARPWHHPTSAHAHAPSASRYPVP